MSSRLMLQVLLALSLMLNAFVLAGFVYRSWIVPPPFERQMPPPLPPQQGQAPPRPSVLEMVTRDLDLDVRHARGDGLGDLPLFGFLRVELRALALDLLLVAFGRDERQLARQQVVARVAVGDSDDFAALSQIVHVLSQNHFHSALRRFQIEDCRLKICAPNRLQSEI